MSFDPEKLLKQRQTQKPTGWFASKLYNFKQAHNRVKHTVHTAWRYPLPRWGRFVMGCVYFSIPVIIGWNVGMGAMAKSDATLEERFGKLTKGDDTSQRIQGLGDKTLVRGKDDERVATIGAGGWGGGVRLATSDKVTQDMNRINLERFLKKQRREMKKREARKKENLKGNDK